MERHISSDLRFFYNKFWITNIKKLVSNILTYLRPVNCFDLNFVFGTSWWKSPTPGISSLSIWLFFFHPNRHSVPEKAKKVVKIFHRWRRRPWEFFFPGLFFLQLGLLIFTFVQVLCGQEHKNPDANDDDVTKNTTPTTTCTKMDAILHSLLILIFTYR